MYRVSTRQAGFDPVGPVDPGTPVAPTEPPSDGHRTETADVPEPSFCIERSVGQVSPLPRPVLTSRGSDTWTRVQGNRLVGRALNIILARGALQTSADRPVPRPPVLSPSLPS